MAEIFHFPPCYLHYMSYITQVLHLLHGITTHTINIHLTSFKYSGLLYQVFKTSQVPSDDKIKPSTSHRRNWVVAPEMTLQNSFFNYLIIRIIIFIALKVTFLCIIIKPIRLPSCFDVGRSYPSLNAFYWLFHALLWGTTYSFIWPHINTVLRPMLCLHPCQLLNSCKDTPSYQKKTLFTFCRWHPILARVLQNTQ